MKKLFLLLLLSGSSAVFSQEICDNGIDDDMDGLIDIQDTVDCKCNFIANSGGSTTISSLIPNPSFENRSCCPSSYSQLNCANVWIQASSATSDYFNTCGFIGYAPTYGQNPPLPLPNGNGYVGFIDNGSSYKEYVGACLSDTMHAGTNYTIQFNMAYSSGNLTYPISIFGSSSCLNLPFTTSGCPSSGSTNWMLLDS